MRKRTIPNAVIDTVYDLTIGLGYDGPMMGHHLKRLEQVNGREFTQQELWELNHEWNVNLQMMGQV